MNDAQLTFYGRQTELVRLRERFSSPAEELVIVSGRRRVGKSRLLLEAANLKLLGLHLVGLVAGRDGRRREHELESKQRFRFLGASPDLDPNISDSSFRFILIFNCYFALGMRSPNTTVLN